MEHLLDATHDMQEVTSADRSLLVTKTCLDVRASVTATATSRPDCPPSPSTPSPAVSPRGDDGASGGDDDVTAVAAAAVTLTLTLPPTLALTHRQNLLVYPPGLGSGSG